LRDYAQRLAAFEAICRLQQAHLRDPAALLPLARKAMATELFWSVRLACERGVSIGDAEIDDSLAFAARLDPSIRHTRGWLAFGVKRMLESRLPRVAVQRRRRG
jgi:hypothetical protein